MTPQPVALWYDDALRDRLQALLADGEPTVTGILATCRAQRHAAPDHAPEPDRAIQVMAAAVEALLTRSQEAASAAVAGFAAQVAEGIGSDLGLGRWGVLGGIVQACIRDVLPADQQVPLLDGLRAILAGLRQVGKGNPHQVGNNWWAVTHSGAHVAALALHGHADADGQIWDGREMIAWSGQRLLAFAQHFGDAGLYHEGLGYQAYACVHLLAAGLAGRGGPDAIAVGAIDLLGRHSNLRRMPLPFHAAACLRAPYDDVSGGPGAGWGAMLSWNDAGQGWVGASLSGPFMALAEPEHLPALRWCFDHFHGLQAPQPDFSGGTWYGWFFSLLFYPYGVAARHPEEVLPKQVCDSRQGLLVARNRYRDGSDAILGAYARSTHVGGHSQADAGSLRFMSLGHDWIMGGGQARGEARWQSVVTPCVEPPPKAACGSVMWEEATALGPLFAMDLRRVSGCYHERYVAAHWGLGDGGALAIFDQLDDHRDLPCTWHLSCAGHLAITVDADGAGFVLRAPDGAMMAWRFVAELPDRIEVGQMPASSRTYAGGNTVHYAGRPVVSAHFPAAAHRAIYVVGCATQGRDVPITGSGHLDLVVDQQPWLRPFGAAIPAVFEPGRSGGLCLHPDGEPLEGFASP